MTVSITPFWKNWPSQIARLLGGWGGVCGVLCLLAMPVQAGDIEAKTAQLNADEQGFALAAQFSILLGTRLEEAVTRGVPLHFRLEFTLERKRKYWVDEHIAGQVLHYRLAYHALTRQYRLSRLSASASPQNFDSLADALAALGQVARLHVVDRTQLIAGETYLAAVRLSLDHEQLPKPLQVDALADREWRVEAKTARWDFVAAAHP